MSILSIRACNAVVLLGALLLCPHHTQATETAFTLLGSSRAAPSGITQALVALMPLADGVLPLMTAALAAAALARLVALIMSTPGQQQQQQQGAGAGTADSQSGAPQASSSTAAAEQNGFATDPFLSPSEQRALVLLSCARLAVDAALTLGVATGQRGGQMSRESWGTLMCEGSLMCGCRSGKLL